METTFVNKKSELTSLKVLFGSRGYETYRTRIKCQCQQEFNHRYGILVIDQTGQIIEKVIRCKSCTSKQKGGMI